MIPERMKGSKISQRNDEWFLFIINILFLLNLNETKYEEKCDSRTITFILCLNYNRNKEDKEKKCVFRSLTSLIHYIITNVVLYL